MPQPPTNSAYRAGVNLGALSALAVRFETDLNEPARAEQLKNIRNSFCSFAIAKAEQSFEYDAIFAIAYQTAFDLFNQPIELEAASALLTTVTTNLCNELLA